MYEYTETDFTQMFLELGFDLPRKGFKGMVSCHKHTDKHPSMSINVRTGLFNCFSCGYHGFIATEYKNQFGKYFNSGSEWDINTLKRTITERVRPKIVARESFFKATYEKYETPILKNWLKYRGIDFKVAETAGAFYGAAHITIMDEETHKERTYTIHDRVMFPIYNDKQQLCSIEMRFPFFGTENKAFISQVKKVLYPKNSTVNILYESYKLDQNSKLYVLEGLMDCLAFRSLTGIKNSTSIFGAQITANQKELLNKFPKICYVYNNDVAGLKSVESMTQFYRGELTLLPPAGSYNDVGDMAKVGYKEVDKWLQKEVSKAFWIQSK